MPNEEHGIEIGNYDVYPGFEPLLALERVTIVFHRDMPLRLNYWMPGSDRRRSRIASPGSIVVKAAREPWRIRWQARGSFIKLAFTPAFVNEIAENLSSSARELRTVQGFQDPSLRPFATLFTRAGENWAEERLYYQTLASALIMHLLRRQPDSSPHIPPRPEALTQRQLRRTLDYIETHLNENLSLGQMASGTGLGTFHFAHAFKTMTGTSSSNGA